MIDDGLVLVCLARPTPPTVVGMAVHEKEKV